MKKLTSVALTMAFLSLSAAKAEAGPFEGAFLGLQLGGTFTNEKASDNLFFQGTNPGAPVSFSIDNAGATVGALGGYRWKFDNFILGIEASGSWTDSRKTLSYDDGGGNITDTEFSRDLTFAIGPKFGYLVKDNLMGFVGADYTIGQFRSHELVNGAAPASCATGTCPNATFIRQGIGLGGGFEMAVMDNLNVRFDYEHTLWQSKNFTDTTGNTAKIALNDDAARLAVIYAFK